MSIPLEVSTPNYHFRHERERVALTVTRNWFEHPEPKDCDLEAITELDVLATESKDPLEQAMARLFSGMLRLNRYDHKDVAGVLVDIKLHVQWNDRWEENCTEEELVP